LPKTTLEQEVAAVARARELLTEAGQNWWRKDRSDPPTADLQVASGVPVHVGWMRTDAGADPTSGIWWELDAVLVSRPAAATDPEAWRELAEDGRLVSPGLLLRPCVDHAVDAPAVRQAFSAWLEAITPPRDQRRTNAAHTWRPADNLPSLSDLVKPRPAGAPARTPAAIQVRENSYTLNTLRILKTASELVRQGEQYGDVLQAYPFIAELAATKDGRGPANSVHRLKAGRTLPRARRQRRPPGLTLPSLESQLLQALESGRSLKRPAALDGRQWTTVRRDFGPLLERFAVEVAIGRELPKPNAEVLATRKLFGFDGEYLRESKLLRANLAGVRRKDAKRRARLNGRHDKTRGVIVRGTAPYLLADTRLTALPLASRWLEKATAPAEVDLNGRTKDVFEAVLVSNYELLLEWIRTDSFVETLQLACGGKTANFRSCVTPRDKFDDLKQGRWMPFHFARVIDTVGDRWVSGFGASVGEVVRRVTLTDRAEASMTITEGGSVGT
jgi:hypothetical protein